LGSLFIRSEYSRNVNNKMATTMFTNLRRITFDLTHLVNTIAFKDTDVIDVDKKNIYPLCYLKLLTSPAESGARNAQRHRQLSLSRYGAMNRHPN
jgi:hypothetical protein